MGVNCPKDARKKPTKSSRNGRERIAEASRIPVGGVASKRSFRPFVPARSFRAGHQQTARSPSGSHYGAYEEQRRAPVQLCNHCSGQGLHKQGAYADSRDGDAGCQAASAVEPFLDRSHRGNVGQPDTSAYADGKGALDMP